MLFRSNKYAANNSIVQFRVDNLRIVELPTPVLHVEPYDATHSLVWWGKVFDNENKGTVLEETSSLQPDGDGQVVWSPSTGTPYYDATRYGRTYLNSEQTKFFRLKVNGAPAI